MSVRIDKDRCVGCGKCIEVCPGNLIKRDEEHKAVILHERDCWACTSCLKECTHSAISLFLGADMGGHGETLRIRKDQGLFLWEVKTGTGEIREIKINPKEANQY